jgi:hypothetical protein
MNGTPADRAAAERAAQGHGAYVVDPVRLSRIAEIVRAAQERQQPAPVEQEAAA